MSADEIASLNQLQPTVLRPDERVRTRLVHAARAQGIGGRAVNVPVTRLSTVLFDNLAQMRDARARRDHERVLSYGARGNPTAFALEDLVTEAGGGTARGCSVPAWRLWRRCLAYLRPGDHVLITDAVYAPVRRLAQGVSPAFRY